MAVVTEKLLSPVSSLYTIFIVVLDSTTIREHGSGKILLNVYNQYALNGPYLEARITNLLRYLRQGV